MSYIYAIGDFTGDSWLITADQVTAGHTDINIGFVDTSNIVTFKSLSFGYSVSLNDKVVVSNTFPSPGVNYVQSEELAVQSETVLLEPEETYTFLFWYVNDGFYVEDYLNVLIPRPETPYPSWSWDAQTKMWAAPSAYPQEGAYYWDEAAMEWKEELA